MTSRLKTYGKDPSSLYVHLHPDVIPTPKSASDPPQKLGNWHNLGNKT